MRAQYSLFQSHLDLAHHYWAALVRPGDLVIDATCGNGKDTERLCQLAFLGKVYALDIQAEAIEATKQRLKQWQHVVFIQGCHSHFPAEIQPETVRLIVYNLGYLPKGDKTLTTEAETTLTSLRHAEELIMPGGAISLTCYPGHPAGKIEQEKLLDYAASLSPHQWSCCHHQWLNRSHSPTLLLLQRSR